MSKLRLGTYLLPPGEVLLIRTLMRLFSQGAAFDWTLAEEGPYDAIIVDARAFKADEATHLASIVLRLTPGRDDPSHNTLQRPIKAEKLQAWLQAAALALHARRNAAEPAPERLLALSQGRFKLLRWPPDTVLQRDAGLIRMSTLLSQRKLQPCELAELSRQPLNACLAFIEQLRGLQLLACDTMAPLADTAPADAAPATAPRARHRGLISELRKRLGL